ncbi:hypothetical protein [Endozoicomonas sp.]|uniref:hypothetical protein n=1 Tax=Endozoicomonas sp. TaxID=1892382 RepID=UPI003839E2A4
MPLQGPGNNYAYPQLAYPQQLQQEQGQQSPQEQWQAEGRGQSSQRKVTSMNTTRMTVPPHPSPSMGRESINDSGNYWQNASAAAMEGQSYLNQPVSHNTIESRGQPADDRCQHSGPTAMPVWIVYTQSVSHKTADPRSQTADGCGQNISPVAVAGQDSFDGCGQNISPVAVAGQDSFNMSHPTLTPAPQNHPPEDITSNRLRQVASDCSLNTYAYVGLVWIHSGLADFLRQVANDVSCLTNQQDIFQPGYYNSHLMYFYLKLEGKPNILNHIGSLAAQLLVLEADDKSYQAVHWLNEQGRKSEWLAINLNAFKSPPQNPVSPVSGHLQSQHPATRHK